MSIRAVILMLLVIVGMAIIAGPGFRRFLKMFLGWGRHGR